MMWGMIAWGRDVRIRPPEKISAVVLEENAVSYKG